MSSTETVPQLTPGQAATAADSGESLVVYTTRQSPAPPSWPVWLLDGLLLALISAGLTYAALQVWPIYDDGSTLQMLVDYGGTIRPNYPDRPFLGQLWQLMADTGQFVFLSSALHWAAWTATAVVTYMLWNTLVPGDRLLALAAACLSLAPVVCKTQLVLVNAPLHGLVAPLLIYGCVLLLLRHPDLQPLSRHWFKSIVIVGAVVCAVLISEYALAAVFAASPILLLHEASTTDGWRRRLPGLVLLAGTALGGYLVYAQLGEVPPHKSGLALLSLEGSFWRLLTAAGRLVSVVWHVGLGGVLEEVGRIQFNSTYFVAAGLVGIVTAITIAGAAGLPGTLPEIGREKLYRHRTILSLVAGIALSMAPVVVLGRTFVGDFQTRTLLPALPLAAITSLLMLSLLLPYRLRWVLIPLCGFLVGYGNTAKTLHALDERRLVAEWGQELRNYVSDEGITVAIFSIPDRRQVPYGNGWISSFSNNELTPRLTADWPAEARQRFWAFRSLEDATGLSRKRAERNESAFLAGVEHDRSTIDPYIDRESRGSTRRGPVQKLLWVQVREQGLSLVIDARETRTSKAQR